VEYLLFGSIIIWTDTIKKTETAISFQSKKGCCEIWKLELSKEKSQIVKFLKISKKNSSKLVL
jgi:hypothetical protein